MSKDVNYNATLPLLIAFTNYSGVCYYDLM